MSHRTFPNVGRALRRLGRATTSEEHDFQRGDDHVQRCVRCHLPHAHWSGGPCPGSPQPWGPGNYV
ncbi:hypothetical protein ACLQ2E_21825 [Streptomyces lavendulocolor]